MISVLNKIFLFALASQITSEHLGTLTNRSDTAITSGLIENFSEMLGGRPTFPELPISNPTYINHTFTQYLNQSPTTLSVTCQNVPTYFDYYQWVERMQHNFDQQFQKLNQIKTVLVPKLSQSFEEKSNILNPSDVQQILFDLSHVKSRVESIDENIQACSNKQNSTNTRIFKTKLRQAGKYLGCFHEDESDPILNGYVIKTRKNTNKFCINTCQNGGFIYAGTGFGEWCMCGNTYPRSDVHNELSAKDCDSSCSGNQNEKCGGMLKMSLYETGVELYIRGVDGTEIEQSFLVPSQNRFYGYREINSKIYDF